MFTICSLPAEYFSRPAAISSSRDFLRSNGSNWRSASGIQRLGQLQLGQTNSILSLPTNSCNLQFRDSSSLSWASNSFLNIQNWSGSLYGGGPQQIIFGTNSAALTPQQLSRIQFHNPAGLPTTNYPARILATGEIVPDTGAPLPPMANLVCATNGLMQLFPSAATSAEPTPSKFPPIWFIGTPGPISSTPAAQ